MELKIKPTADTGKTVAPVSGVSWRESEEVNSYNLMIGGRWIARILMNGELYVSYQTHTMDRIVTALGYSGDLITAAPELLDMLERLVARHPVNGKPEWDVISGLLDEARNLIKKAKGET